MTLVSIKAGPVPHFKGDWDPAVADSTGYKKSAIVFHNGHSFESKVNANKVEPAFSYDAATGTYTCSTGWGLVSVGAGAEQTSTQERIKRDLGYNATQSTIVLTPGETGKYVKCETRSAVANPNFNISAPFDVEACSELLIKTGYNPSDNAHAPLDISVIAIYEEMERIRTVQAKYANNNPLYYVVDEDGNPTGETTTVQTDYPVYTTETYTEHRYLPNNEDRWVAIPDSGYYVANIPQSCKCVVSYKPGVTDLNVIVVKHGALANLTSQIFGIYEHRTMGEAVTSLAYRLTALEDRIARPGNIKCGTVDAVEITKLLYPTVLISTGVPAAELRPTNIDASLPWDGIPVFIGQMYLDITNKKLYVANGVTAISNWFAVN